MSVATGIRGAAHHNVRGTAKGVLATLTIALALTSASPSKADDGTGEQEMCQAFRAYLSAEVQGVLDFVRETAGPEGLARVYRAHTDRFEISSFNAPRCRQVGRTANSVCSFHVGVETVRGMIERTVTGCFISKVGNHLAFMPYTEGQPEIDGDGSISPC